MRFAEAEYQGAIVNPTERVVVGYGIRLQCHGPGTQRTCVVADCAQQNLECQRTGDNLLIQIITWLGTVMRLLYAERRWTGGGIAGYSISEVPWYAPARMPGK